MSDSQPKFTIDMVGSACPVQAEGKVGDLPYYFRARGQHWTFSVGHDVFEPIWEVRVRYGPDSRPFAAGWMEEEEACAIVEACCNEYLASTAKNHRGLNPHAEAPDKD